MHQCCYTGGNIWVPRIRLLLRVMQLHGTWIWTCLLLVVLRQWSFLDLNIVLLKNHRICKLEVLFEKGEQALLYEDFIYQGNMVISECEAIQEHEFQSSSFHWCIYVLFIYSKFIWHLLHTMNSGFWDVVCGPGSLSGALFCFIWLSNIKPVYTLMPVSIYSSLDGGLSLHLQPGDFQSVGEVERREGRIQGGNLFPFL